MYHVIEVGRPRSEPGNASQMNGRSRHAHGGETTEMSHLHSQTTSAHWGDQRGESQLSLPAWWPRREINSLDNACLWFLLCRVYKYALSSSFSPLLYIQCAEVTTFTFNLGVTVKMALWKKTREMPGTWPRAPREWSWVRANGFSLFCNEGVLFWFTWNMGTFLKNTWEEMKDGR